MSYYTSVYALITQKNLKIEEETTSRLLMTFDERNLCSFHTDVCILRQNHSLLTRTLFFCLTEIFLDRTIGYETEHAGKRKPSFDLCVMLFQNHFKKKPCTLVFCGEMATPYHCNPRFSRPTEQTFQTKLFHQFSRHSVEPRTWCNP